MKKYEAILYDIDGTLLNTLNMNMIPLIRIIKEELNEDWSYEEVLRFVPYPGMKVMEELKVKDKEKVYSRWVKYVNEYEEGASIYENIDYVLEEFYGKVKQAVVSAKTKKQYEIDFVSKGLDKYMEAKVLADDTERHKPDPQPINKCLEILGVAKEKAIFIGDSLSDYKAAINAGVDFGYATWGSVSSEGIENPTLVFDSQMDIVRLIES